MWRYRSSRSVSTADSLHATSKVIVAGDSGQATAMVTVMATIMVAATTEIAMGTAMEIAVIMAEGAETESSSTGADLSYRLFKPLYALFIQIGKRYLKRCVVLVYQYHVLPSIQHIAPVFGEYAHLSLICD